MDEGASEDSATTSHGRRRPRASAPESTPTAPPGAAPAADATGLGVRRTGAPPSLDAETSMVGLRPSAPDAGPAAAPPAADVTGLGTRRAGPPPSSDAETSLVPRPGAADATGLGRRRPSAPGPAPSGAPADATGLGIRRTGRAPSLDAETSMVGLRRPATGPMPSATGLGHRRPGGAPGGHPGHPGPGGGAVGRSRGPHDVVRFGPGAPGAGGPPPAPAEAPAWQRPAPAPEPPRRRRGRPLVGGLLTLLAVAAVVAYLLTRSTAPVGVQGVSVVAEPAEAGCDTTVVLVGTVATEGGGGTFSYRWERSDGQVGEVLRQSVGAGALRTDVRLQWTVSGPGRLDGAATLRVLDGTAPTPDATVGTGNFTYSCG